MLVLKEEERAGWPDGSESTCKGLSCLQTGSPPPCRSTVLSELWQTSGHRSPCRMLSWSAARLCVQPNTGHPASQTPEHFILEMSLPISLSM